MTDNSYQEVSLFPIMHINNENWPDSSESSYVLYWGLEYNRNLDI